MKKFLSNTIVQLLIAVIIGLLAGFVVNDAVLEVVICIKHITGQIIFFLVPLIILGFIAPSIAHLRSNASKMLLFAFGIAYLSSIGASFFGAAVGYNVIPFLHMKPFGHQHIARNRSHHLAYLTETVMANSTVDGQMT